MNAQRMTGTASLQVVSLIAPDGELKVSLDEMPIPALADDQVLVRVQASPINPSDLMLMFGAADMSTIRSSGSAARPQISARIVAAAMASMAGRFGSALPVGSEGAGLVVDAGASAAAQALLGKTVAFMGAGAYAQYKAVPADQCLLLPQDVTPAEGASSFINPLTALGMVETMRREGHTAIVHTAAASSLGQILNRLCQADGIGLVNIVRKPEQVVLLKSMGATHVCDSSEPTFQQDLERALEATGATLAFEATGGGQLAGQILAAMETALNRQARSYSRYGSGIHKQVYVYGRLATGPTTFNLAFGLAWGMGGWSVFGFLQRTDPAALAALKRRVAGEIKTTFASRYKREISLAELLTPDVIGAYARRATGEKFLLNPSTGLANPGPSGHHEP